MIMAEWRKNIKAGNRNMKLIGIKPNMPVETNIYAENTNLYLFTKKRVVIILLSNANDTLVSP
jgi:hypothetical protein